MNRKRDWGIWKDIQRAMRTEGIRVSDRLLKEVATDWESRREWDVIRSLMMTAKRKGIRPRDLILEYAPI